MDSRVGGDAIEVEQLVEAEPQDVLQGWLLGPTFGAGRNDPVEG